MMVRPTIAVLCANLALSPSLSFPRQIPPDTPFRVRLVSAVSTRNNVKGDKVVATVLSPEEFKGDLMEGVIQESKGSGRVNKKSTLRFGFTALHHQGRPIDIRADVVAFYNSKGQANVDEEGQVISKSSGTARAALLSAIGAGIGAAAGGAKGAAIGAGAGLAAGLLFFSFAVKGPNVSFDTNSEFELSVRAVPGE